MSSVEPKNIDLNIKKPKVRVLVTGNPGVGKSHILNILINREVFKSGRALSSVTACIQEEEQDDYIFVDVPGLMEPKNVERNKKAIMEGLTKDSNYVVIFVMTLEGFRVRYQDTEALRLLVQSYDFEPHQILILFNKVESPLTDHEIAERLEFIREATKVRCEDAAYIEFRESRETFLPRLNEAIQRLIPKHIPASEVKPLKLTEDVLKGMIQQTQQKEAEMKAEFEKMKSAHAAEVARLEKSIKEANERPPQIIHVHHGGGGCEIM